MIDKRLTEELARSVMGWRLAPDRFLRTGRSWTPRYRFTPLTSTDHAFQLLDRAGARYRLTFEGTRFAAEVWVGDQRGEGSGERKARTITVALARALQIEV
jgi:hypothetical protein